MTVLVFNPRDFSRPLKSYVLPSGIILGNWHDNALVYTNKD